MLGIYKTKTRPLAIQDNIVQGANYRITLLTEALVRLEYSEDGFFEDRATQFAFFRKYAELDIHILAWNALTEQVHYFSAASLLDKKSVYFADGMQNVDLNYAESMNFGVPFDVWLSMLEAVWGA